MSLHNFSFKSVRLKVRSYRTRCVAMPGSAVRHRNATQRNASGVSKIIYDFMVSTVSIIILKFMHQATK